MIAWNKKRLITSLVTGCLLTALSGYGQQALQWPVITQQNKPWTRWWWQGSAVDKAGLTSAMQKYRDAGLGGLEITPIYGVQGTESRFIPYLSAQWMGMLDFTLREAKRLNLGIDMATGTGWPFGGPWVTPEDACKDVNLKTYKLRGGERLHTPVTYIQKPLVRTANGKVVDIKTLSYPIATNNDMQGYAFDQVKYEMPLPLTLLMAYSEKGDTLDLTAKTNAAGALDWVAPAGNWTLYALFQGWHGKLVERAAPGGEGDAIDHFSISAMHSYLGHFDEAFKGHDIRGIRAFFNDSYEVDDARGQANWTPSLLAEFKKRRGYDLRDHLPALFTIDTTDKSKRILYDYRQTISELLLENFTSPWHAWAAAKGAKIRNQSHGSPANILDLYAAIDIPETEGTNILRFKFATSAAHVTGKPLASAESATWLGEHFQSGLGDVKRALDNYFVGGVNHIFYHGTNYSPPDAEWPGWLFYAAVHFTPANPFWRNFSTLNQYVSHVQSFLQKGKADNDVLLYFPVNDRFSQPLALPRRPPGRNANAYTDGEGRAGAAGQAADALRVIPPGDSTDAAAMILLQHFDGMEGFDGTVFEATAEYLLDKGYAFDLISDKQIRQVTSSGKSLVTGGVSYQTILLSDCQYIPFETMEQLFNLARAGATVIFHKNYPSEVPGYGRQAARKAGLDKLLSGLSFQAGMPASVKEAVVGNGRFLLGDDLLPLLEKAKIRRETMTDQGLLFVRRKETAGTTYFISNNGKKAVHGWVPIAVPAGWVAIFDPMQLRSGIARIQRPTPAQTSVYLQLAPGESCVLQPKTGKIAGKSFPYLSLAGKAVPIAGDWEIKFIDGGPELPATGMIAVPGSWTDLPGEAVKKFSGTASYSISVKKPALKASAWLLDLGRVEESAEVLLNGKILATLIGPPYQVVIPSSLLAGDNLLQVNVTNGMANRIADLDKRGVAWKKFYNVNFPSRLAQNRDANGIFTAAKWDPKPSGLMGPVTMTPIE